MSELLRLILIGLGCQLLAALVLSMKYQLRPDKTFVFMVFFWSNIVPLLQALAGVALTVVLWHVVGPDFMRMIGQEPKEINEAGAAFLGMFFQIFAKSVASTLKR